MPSELDKAAPHELWPLCPALSPLSSSPVLAVAVETLALTETLAETPPSIAAVQELAELRRVVHWKRRVPFSVPVKAIGVKSPTVFLCDLKRK